MSTNQSVCHNFVHSAPNASWSNRVSNLSYHGNKFYSYSSVLARIKHPNDIHIDHRIARYSSTSSKHASLLRRSIPEDFTVFEYDFSATNPLAWYLDQCMLLLDKQSRARKADYTSQVITYIDEALLYATTYKSDKRSSIYRQLAKLDTNRDHLLDSVKDIIAASNKAKLIAKRKQDKLMQAKRQATLDKFTGGGVKYDANYNGVYLAIKDDYVVTTNSIKVPLREATLMYRRYVSGKPILGLELDGYRVVKANNNSVTIGCTLLSNNELKRVLNSLL